MAEVVPKLVHDFGSFLRLWIPMLGKQAAWRLLSSEARRAWSPGTPWSAVGASGHPLVRFFAAEGSPSGPPPVLPPLQHRGSQAPQRHSDVTTAVRPTLNSEWSEVVIRETNQVYYWNERTGQTTAVGEPRPGQPVQPQQQQQIPSLGFRGGGAPQTTGRTLASLVAMGAGVGLMFGVIGKLL